MESQAKPSFNVARGTTFKVHNKRKRMCSINSDVSVFCSLGNFVTVSTTPVPDT